MNKESIKYWCTRFYRVKNLNADILSVLFKKPVFKGISQKELVQQIESKKKCKNKLPLWFNTSNIYYPKKIQIEQTSSEITATHKASLVGGKSLLDLTGGFGVDSFFFSKKVAKLVHCELDQELSEIAQHNLQSLGASNIHFVNEDSITYLNDSQERFDWIYADPSRRSMTKGKVFLLEDCLPNIPEMLPLLFSKTNNILIKTAPLLDISAGLQELENVKEIHVVALKNEVKELLWVLQNEFEGDVLIKTINFIRSDEERFNFSRSQEKKEQSIFSEPLSYLYEPNAAILKSGGFKTVGSQFKLKKLASHTHLYTSTAIIDFPGRRFKVEALLPYSKKNMLSLKVDKANVAVRNFPEKVAALRKKFKIKDGGVTYLFFTKDAKDNLLILKCKKI